MLLLDYDIFSTIVYIHLINNDIKLTIGNIEFNSFIYYYVY